MPWLERKCFPDFIFVDKVPENTAHQVAINALFEKSTENSFKRHNLPFFDHVNNRCIVQTK